MHVVLPSGMHGWMYVVLPSGMHGTDCLQTSKNDPNGEFAEAKRAAATADVTVLAVGLTANVRDAEGVGTVNSFHRDVRHTRPFGSP
jgi:hypothetical protein